MSRQKSSCIEAELVWMQITYTFELWSAQFKIINLSS